MKTPKTKKLTPAIPKTRSSSEIVLPKSKSKAGSAPKKVTSSKAVRQIKPAVSAGANLTRLKKELELPVYDLSGKEIETITLSKNIFAGKINRSLIRQALHIYNYNQRGFKAATKTRGQVRGSTKKIYRQKGTGNARHGSITAPIFVGGGIVFGPQPKTKKLVMPKKMRRQTFISALTDKFVNGKMFIFEVGKFSEKTNKLDQVFRGLFKSRKSVFYVSSEEKNLIRYVKNIPYIYITGIDSINIFSVLNCDNLVFSKNALVKITQTYDK